jgi:hypothetical protein
LKQKLIHSITFRFKWGSGGGREGKTFNLPSNEKSRVIVLLKRHNHEKKKFTGRKNKIMMIRSERGAYNNGAQSN